MLDSGLGRSHQLFLAAMMVSEEEGEPLLTAANHSVDPLLLAGVSLGEDFSDNPCDLGEHGVSGCVRTGHWC